MEKGAKIAVLIVVIVIILNTITLNSQENINAGYTWAQDNNSQHTESGTNTVYEDSNGNGIVMSNKAEGFINKFFSILEMKIKSLEKENKTTSFLIFTFVILLLILLILWLVYSLYKSYNSHDDYQSEKKVFTKYDVYLENLKTDIKSAGESIKDFTDI